VSVHNDTIVAKATANGQGAIAIIRISGPAAFALVSTLTRGKSENLKSHYSRVRPIYFEGRLLDEALITQFKAPHSFTGEDCTEISIHSSNFISNSILQALTTQGARLAEPGEFTMRAYLNGKMDLAQAEAVADLIASGSMAEHKLALQQMRGGVSDKIQMLRAKILEFASLLELELDFGEEDVEFADRGKLMLMVESIRSEIELLLHSFKVGNAMKEGIPVAIVGKPNAGKSTLLNAILGEERAIVTDIPGTTRDTIEENKIIGGLRFRFIDTAGIRASENKIEQIGIERTFQTVKRAQLILLVVDIASTSPEDIAAQQREIEANAQAEIWFIGNKTDQLNGTEKIPELPWIKISAKTGQIGVLDSELEKYANKIQANATDFTVSNLRHFEVLKSAFIKVNEIIVAIENKLSSDILAHHMREAMKELGRITGEIDSEEILDQIFSKFCIGK
jgi:tRNA modification GTPase